MRLATVLCAIVACVAAPAAARADESEAKDLLREGVALRRDHRNAEALDRFERAFALSPSPIARAQIALAEQALGRWQDAGRDLDLALESEGDPWIANYHQVLEEARLEISAHLAWVTIEVSALSATATINGESAAPGVEQRVAAGPAVLHVQAPGYLSEDFVVALAPREHKRVPVSLSAKAEPARDMPLGARALTTPEPAAPQGVSPWMATLAGPAVLGTLGAAGLVVGAIFGLHAQDEQKTRDGQCHAGGCTLAGFMSDAEVRRASMVSTAAMGTGFALLAAGTTWAVADAKLAERAPPGSNAPTVGPLVLGASGLATASLGTCLGLYALAKKRARDASCSALGCLPDALDYDAEARTSATLSTVSFGASVAFWAAAAILWRTHPGTHRASWYLAPRLSWQTAGLSVAGTIE